MNVPSKSSVLWTFNLGELGEVDAEISYRYSPRGECDGPEIWIHRVTLIIQDQPYIPAKGFQTALQDILRESEEFLHAVLRVEEPSPESLADFRRNPSED